MLNPTSDESGSLSDAEVADEIQAAGIIAQTQLNPNSRVTIIGFGGINGSIAAPRPRATTPTTLRPWGKRCST